MRVVRIDGSPITYRESIIRTVSRVIDGFAFYLVAVILVATSPLKQRLGDRIAGTTVVRKDSITATSPSA
jgi:uncharacterized RDD family membrane protein YckC